MEPLSKKERCDTTMSYPPEATADIEELQRALQQSQADRSQLQARVTELEAERDHIQADRDQLQGRVTDLEANRERIEADRDQLRDQVLERDERIASLEATLSAMAHDAERNANDDDDESSAESQSEDSGSDDDLSIATSIASTTGLPGWLRRDYELIVRMLQGGKCDRLEILWPAVPYIVENIDDFSGLLRANSAIRQAWVDLEAEGLLLADPALCHHSMTKLGEALGSLKALEELYLSSVDDFATAASIVKYTKQIRTFEMRAEKRREVDPEGERDSAEVMADSLCDLPSLENIIVKNVTPEEAGIITSIFPTLPKLHKTCLGFWQGEGAESVLPAKIFSVLRIQTLREATFACCTITESGIYVIAECLRDIGSLLTKLKFVCCTWPAEQRAADLAVAAVKKNYVLEAFDGINRRFHSPHNAFANPNQWSLLESFPRLNKAGRGYLKDDPTSISKGVQVLSQVNEDTSCTDLKVLDCLFLRLQENPLLCKFQGGAQQSGMKRKAEESRKKTAKK